MRPRMTSLGLCLLLAATSAACGSKSSGSASGSGAHAPAKTATARPTAAEPPEPPRPTSPFEAPGDPLSGEQGEPGDSAEIPRAKGFVITAPKGFRIDKDAAGSQLVLLPERGTGKVVIAADEGAKGLDQRVTKFLQESVTSDEKWQEDKDTSVGPAQLAGQYARGVGYQGFPGGRREPHKLLRVRIPTDVKEGAGTLTIQALAVWNGADVEMEVAVVDAVKGIHRK